MSPSKPKHPCLSCRLPDCDDESKRCPLRRIAAQFQYMAARRQPIPDDLREQHRIAKHELWEITYNERRRARYHERQGADAHA